MPAGGKPRKAKEPSTFQDPSFKEDILKMVEARMSEVFSEQYEDLKDKLITLMAKELSKLRENIDNIEREFQTFKEGQAMNSMAIAESSHESQDMQNKQHKKTESLTKNIAHLSEQLHNFEVEIDATRQQLKENNVRIVGLPEHAESESEESAELFNDVIEFSKSQLNMTSLNKDDIAEVHRLGRKSKEKARDIIVKFKYREIRNKFYQRRKQLYSEDNRKSITGIYINEDLTQHRQRLYFDTRNLRKRAAINAVWTSSGTIMIKLNENSTPQAIQTHRDLANLLRQNKVEV